MKDQTRASGKAQKIDEAKKQREAALQSATPPPQDDPPQPEPKQEPKPDTPPQEGADTAKEDKPAIGDVDYKDAYRRTQAELEKEKQRARSMDGRLRKQSEELQSLKAKLENQGESDASVAKTIRNSDRYKKLVEDYDEETAENIAGLVEEFAQPPTPPEPSHDEPFSGEPSGGISSYDEFVVHLDTQVPGWDLKYNNNQDFIKWAKANTEPYSGKTYLALLNEAANDTFDPQAAKNIFSAFDRQVQSPSTPRPDDYVEPTPTGGDGPAQPPAPTYREGDLEAMAQQVRKGKKTRKEFEDFKREFVQAQREGRVQA